MKTKNEVLEDLKTLIGRSVEGIADDIICMFEDFEDPECECGVLVEDSGNPSYYDFYATVNREDSTYFYFKTERYYNYENGECIDEILIDVWEE